MATNQMSEVLRHLRGEAGVTDGRLLERFLARRDGDAFAELVRRHGPMVFGVCRRVLRSHHDAEDAFQAAFLVLARKAASVASRGLLAGWLYGVAYRTALKARAAAAKRQARERQVAQMPEPEAADGGPRRDLEALLDEELSRLPDKYRLVIVLCDLEGRTRNEAASRFGVPAGTVAGRLTRGRAMLAKRLARRGVTVSGAALAAVLVPGAVPASAAAATVKAAALGRTSAAVAALTEGALRSMLLSKLKGVALVGVLLLCAAGLTAGALTYRAAAAESARPATAAPLTPDDTAKPPGRADDGKQAPGADDLRGVIDHVLHAYGGEAKVRGLKAFTWKVKYPKTEAVQGNECTEDYSVQVPDKYRMENATKGEAKRFIHIFNTTGFRRWTRDGDGKVEEVFFLGVERPAEYWIDYITHLGPRGVLRLKDPANKLSLLDPIKVGGRAAVGVLVKREGAPELKLYFDKETGLLLREEHPAEDVVILYADYQRFDGVPVPRKTTQKLNKGTVTLEGELLEFKAVDKFDAKVFEKP
jgi:RNA polymerase sigma factor (sigma-70 family)